MHGPLRVSVRNKCPEVAVADALTLIRELEEKELEKLNDQVSTMVARLETLRQNDEVPWDSSFEKYLTNGMKHTLWEGIRKCPYLKDLPMEVQELLLESFEVDSGSAYLKNLPLSRRERKRLMASTSWVVHLYAGSGSGTTSSDPMKAINRHGKVLLEIDVCNSRLWDLHKPNGAYQLLLWAASQGRIEDVLGGPPCRTYSALLHRPGEGYPQPARSAAFPYGLPDLDPRRAAQVHGDTAPVAKQLLVWNLAYLSRHQQFVGFFLEHPRDPQDYMNSENSQDLNEYPSLWRTTLWSSFKELFGMFSLSYDQGELGHRAKKPTTNGTNYTALLHLDGLQSKGRVMIPATLLSSEEQARWAPGLKLALARAVIGPSALLEGEGGSTQPTARKLSATERELWRKHLECDHQPYRPDCSVCVNAQATGHQHRRVPHPTAFTLAVDLAGPFKHKGRDMDFRDYKYLLVGAFRFPKAYLQVLNT